MHDTLINIDPYFTQLIQHTLVANFAEAYENID